MNIIAMHDPVPPFFLFRGYATLRKLMECNLVTVEQALKLEAGIEVQTASFLLVPSSTNAPQIMGAES